jgi:TonB family protein
MTVNGTGGDDVYHSAQTVASTGPINFFGFGGNDDFVGGLGDDVLQGGDGDDTLDGGSGGINTAALSRGYGSGAGSLTGHTTTQVTSSTLAAQADDGVRRGSGSTKAARSREEIELIFDRNKGAIYALYSRALRDNPELKGKVVLELTIAPTGEITQCRIVSSELNNEELERKLVARVKSFRFEARDVETITTTKPIDFFPA